MSDYRYMTNNDGTITRGRLYRLPSDWTSDAWSNYWDGNGMVGFYEEYARGQRTLHDDADNDRALAAYQSAKNYDTDPDVALRSVARRITGQWDADFICVGLDRGMDFYVLSWGGANDEWRREIEAVSEGDIYRIECEVYLPYVGEHGCWLSEDEYPEEFYGEDKASAEFTRVFDMAEFPAERFVSEPVGA